MKCHACNAEVADDTKFCPQCGAKLAGPAEAPPPASPMAPAGRGRRQDVPEEVLWEGRYSPKAMLGSVLLAAVISIALLTVAAVAGSGKAAWTFVLVLIAVLWVAVIARGLSKRLGISYKLTNHMFYHQRGLLTYTTDRIEVIDIDDITYRRGPIERLVGVGRVTILSSDRSNPRFEIEGLDDVEGVAKTMDRARRAERIRRGVSVESLSAAPGGHDGGG